MLSEERGGCCSPRPGCGYSRATRRGTSHPLNCRRFQPSQSTDPHQPAFALGSPVGVGIEGLAGEVESSCSHPREAMNLVHVRRISRRNRTEEEEEEEESLFKADAVNEEDSERDRATQV